MAQTQIIEEDLTEISRDSAEMNERYNIVRKAIEYMPIPPFYDREFVVSLLEMDMREHIKIYRDRSHHFFIAIDELNGIYMPFTVFVCTVIPMYLAIQVRSSFNGITSIRDVLNQVASSIQDELERVTLAASEEEFKEAKFNKKDIPDEELDEIIQKHIDKKYTSSEKLIECPVCGAEDVEHYVECGKCRYKYCIDCCKQIASRQATCPCCREDLTLNEYLH